MQEPHHARRPRNRVRGYQVAADHEQPFDRNTVGDQPSVWWNNPRDGDATAMSYPHTSVSSTYSFSDQVVWPEPAVQDPSGIDGTFNTSQYPAHFAVGEPVGERSPVTYQPALYDQVDASISPAVSPTDRVSAVIPETTYDPTGPTPSSEYQAGQAWTVPTHRCWEAETGIASDPILDRRWSMQARQGSDATFSIDAVPPILMNPPNAIQEHDGSGASGGTTPVERVYFVDGFVGGDNAPWCPEFPHQEPNYRYPY
ncbi:hypothetical protein F4782DRAFT_527015 [Xylaria castorea]|nr:hypothetical protein F4782DRAFT_527015 [Xylaria castorea]